VESISRRDALRVPARFPIAPCALHADLSRMSGDDAAAAAAAASETAAEGKLPAAAEPAKKKFHVDAKPMRQRQYEAIVKYLLWVPTKKFLRAPCPPAVRTLLDKEFVSWDNFRSEICKHASVLLGLTCSCSEPRSVVLSPRGERCFRGCCFGCQAQVGQRCAAHCDGTCQIR
jgi:hypothetical protein